MSVTIREIVDEALPMVGEVAGAGSETYTEDAMMADAIRAFNLLFTKYPWEQYRQWVSFTLDGTTGKPTAGLFDYVRGFEDFLSVYADNSSRPLPILPKTANPSYFNGTGTTTSYWTSLAATATDYKTKRLQFYPVTSTEKIWVQARVYPIKYNEDWDWEDTMELDRDMLIAGTAFLSLSRDETSASAADLQRTIMEMKFKDIMDALAKQTRTIGNSGANLPTEYFVPYP